MKLMVIVEGMASPYRPGTFRRPQPVDRPGGIRPMSAHPDVGGRPVPAGPGRRAAEAYHEATHPEVPPEKALVAADLMTSPVLTVKSGALVDEASRLFREHRFRHLPVSTDGERVEGILSDRDVLAAGERARTRPVREIMHAKVLVASPETGIRDIARVLFEERIGAMPLVDDTARLVGILTRTDILRALVNRAPLDIWI